MRPQLASFFNGLDGVTYFFVSSGIFVLVTAALFFSLGLWIGALTWGRFKRRFRAGQETIEDMKNELALLKRRTAELASRSLPHQQRQAQAIPRSPLAALVQAAPLLPPQPGAAFTLWTEPGWIPQATPAAPLPASAAFTLWPLPAVPAVPIVPVNEAATTSTTAASGAGEALQFTVEHIPQPTPQKLPKSQAFTLWMEPGFAPLPQVAPRPGHTSLVAAAASAIKRLTGFPKAGAATPTFGDWLHSQAARPEKSASPAPRQPVAPSEAFHAELTGGIVRNDYLLGIVFINPPQQCDDLSKLDGITRPERETLEAFGVHRFKQIAYWNHDHAEEFARRLGLRNKERAVKWIGQAASLCQETGGAPS